LVLLVIALLNWLDVDYFGSARLSQFSPAARQLAHFSVFAATFFLGRFYYSGVSKTWVASLWTLIYVAGFVSTTIVAALAFFHAISASSPLFDAAVDVRIVLEGPLPFLALYLFARMADTPSKAG
jgi:hypothetical protein